MSIRFGFILGALFLLSSCAQIEVLSGGDKDIYAPQPDLGKMSPTNGSVNFQGQEMIIPFNEFFTLNNPGENIVVVPPDFKVKAKIKKKNLLLSWEESPKQNTTYAFYLNGAIQDLSEKNDSLMQFVFSSGPSIDSLKASFVVRDAYTKEPLSNHTIGLYQEYNDTSLPRYFGKTDKAGFVHLSYLSAGKYVAVAFDDKNKNLRPDISESFGFLPAELIVSDSLLDTLSLQVSPPKSIPKITTLTLVPPGAFMLAANRSLENIKLTLNGSSLKSESFYMYSKDSILVPFEYSDTSFYELIVKASNWADTASFRMTQGEKNVDLVLNPSKKTAFFQDEALVLVANQNLTSADVSQFQLLNAKDSSRIEISRSSINGTRLELDYVRKPEITSVFLSIPAFSILATHSRNTDTLLLKFSCLSDKDVGVLRLMLEDFENDVIVEMLANGKTESKILLKKGNWSHLYKNLMPGEYTFRVSVDLNENGLWDGGDFSSKTEPEEVIEFNQSKKVRGNWESEIILKKSGIGN